MLPPERDKHNIFLHISTHISWAKASHIATPHIKKACKCNTRSSENKELSEQQ